MFTWRQNLTSKLLHYTCISLMGSRGVKVQDWASIWLTVSKSVSYAFPTFLHVVILTAISNFIVSFFYQRRNEIMLASFFHQLPYSGKFFREKSFEGETLRDKTFANCKVLWLLIKVFSTKFGGMASFSGISEHFAKAFHQNLIFHQFAKAFSLDSFPLYRIYWQFLSCKYPLA